MKLNITRIVAVTLAFAITSSSVAMAKTFKDVPSTHWGYSAISDITDRGYMMGDLSGKFNPDSYIDKFSSSKILAKASGYKDSNLTNEEKSYYDKIYTKYKDFLTQYSNKFKKWNATADREIAYLLEKQILVTEDLNQFVIKNQDGTESIRALSREEISTFLVRMMGKTIEASSSQSQTKFADDGLITENRKNHVYYLKSINIISGDTANKFNPKGAVTNAAMALLLQKSLGLMNGTAQQAPVASQTPVVLQPPANNIESVSCTFQEYFPTVNVIQATVNGVQKLYTVSQTASIKVNGMLSTMSELKKGMLLTCVLNNSEVIQIDAAQTTAVNLQTAAPSASVPGNLSNIEGVVSAFTNEAFTKTISVDFRMVSPSGATSTETRVYSLDSSCTIKRGDSAAAFTDIKINDIISGKVSDGIIYSIQLEEKNKDFEAVLIKKNLSSSSAYSITVEDSNKKTYELLIDDDTEIERKGQGDIEWYELRVGDTLDITAEYNKAVDIYATGTNSTVEGTINAIRISYDFYEIDLKSSGGTVKTYPVVGDNVDIYSIRLGNKVKLRLESQEISSMSILSSDQQDYYTGKVTSIRNDYMTVRNSTNTGVASKQIYFTDSTIYIDSVSGKQISRNGIYEGINVYVILEDSYSNKAKTVTLLNE